MTWRKRVLTAIFILLIALVAGIGIYFVAEQPIQDYVVSKQSNKTADQYVSILHSQNKINKQRLQNNSERFVPVDSQYADGSYHGNSVWYARGVVQIDSINLRLPIYRNSTAGLNAGAVEEIDNSHAYDNLYVVAAHDSYIPHKWFTDLFNVKNGDLITIYTPLGTFNYRAKKHYIVDQSVNDVLTEPGSGSKLIRLFTCTRTGHIHPSTRYVLEGVMVGVHLNQRGEKQVKMNKRIKETKVSKKIEMGKNNEEK